MLMLKGLSRRGNLAGRSLVVGAGLWAALVVTAHAQLDWSGWSEFLPGLSKEDYAVIASKVDDELEGKPEGSVVNWKNPQSGNSGIVQLIASYEWDGHKCRRYIHVLHLVDKRSKTQVWQEDICKIGDTWKWPIPPRRL